MTGGGGTDGNLDFFVSYTGVDRPWAEWIAWTLEAAGYRTLIQTWDFGPGSGFVEAMHQAAQSSPRTVAVCPGSGQARPIRLTTAPPAPAVDLYSSSRVL
ncbi:toll/interleukin-1 receptor domain-containing protein [Protofrankia symbiont of Coriaria ruscifolia]|uniref:toll/interleukin-1 receptor domain-containing protein n=1 Tax=Protofrankia symbiont of Coriaria ruscifolia TaxID=1306542 RepID=UPI001F5E8C9B|nr:toll/interleukin-1 receptor domain-containing protein [Protofrankia symbiont of Coriaria ruscifolia]